MWRTAEAVVEEWSWLSVLVVTKLVSADGALSMTAWSWENVVDAECDASPLEPYRLLGALMDAAELTGLELPFELQVCDDDMLLVLTDRSRAMKLIDALHYRPRMDAELAMMCRG